MKYVVCLHTYLYIPWKFGERGSTPRGAIRGRVCLFLFVHHATMYRHRKPRRYVYALNLGGTGISPLDKNPPGQKCPRAAVAGNWTILVLLLLLLTLLYLVKLYWICVMQKILDVIGLQVLLSVAGQVDSNSCLRVGLCQSVTMIFSHHCLDCVTAGHLWECRWEFQLQREHA